MRVRDLYRRQGRLATTVEAKRVDQGDGRVEVVFVIKEGEVSKVDSISFVGNRAYSQSDLRGVISTSQSGWLDVLKSAAFYDPERIDNDKELVRRHYQKNGFPDARVVEVAAVKNAEGTGYAVTFTVEEGERYAFGGAVIDSKLSGVDTAGLQSAISIRPGSAYNQESVDKSVEKMMLTLSDQGQASARVKAVPKRNAAGRTVDIAFNIEQGPRVFVERIDIVGNKKTKDFVIRREFRIEEGMPVNAFLIERGRKRVQALGFFKSVAINHKTGSAPDKMVITIAVVEQETNNLSFGVGYSMAEGVAGDISLVERNFLGNGQWLRLKVEGSLTRLQAEVGFTEPRFMGSNVAAGFDLFYKDVDYTKQASYMSQKIGGTLRASYPIDEQWSVGTNYTFSRNRLYDVGSTASAAIKEAIPGFPDATSSTYYTSSVGYSVTYDTRDNKKRPSSGVYYSVAQDLAGVGGDVRFIRSVGEARALLCRDRRHHRRRPSGRRRHHRLGRPGRAPARPVLSRRRDGARLCHRRHRPARHPERQPGRAGRPHVLRHDRRAACSRFRACRKTSACAARCSPTPARCGASTAPPARCRGSPATRRRCVRRWVWGWPGILRSGPCGSTTPTRS